MPLWLTLRDVPQRAAWLATFVILAVVLAGVLVDRAPISIGRLRDAADDIELPFHRQVAERASGNSRCTPCPRLTRTFDGPDVAVEAAVIEVAAIAANAGYPLRLTPENRSTGRFTSTDGEHRLTVVVRRDPDGGGTVLEMTFEDEARR